MRRQGFTLTAPLLALLLAACSSSQILDPVPRFDWLDAEESEIQSIMQTLAISISRMEDAMGRNLAADEQRQAVDVQLEIIEELSELLALDSTNASAGTDNARSHHVVRQHIGMFLTQVREARKYLLHKPPNYFVAGKIAGHCQSCHQFRDNAIY